MIILKINHSISNKIISDKSSIKKVDISNLNDVLELETWDDVYNSKDVNEAFDLFLNILNNHILNCTDIIIKKNNKYNKLKPWINTELIQKINFKNKLFKKLKKHPNDLVIQNEYKNVSKQLVREIAKFKEAYYFEKFYQNGNDAKKNWNLVNNIISNPKKSCIPEKIMSTQNIILSEKLEIASDFNNYFANIAVTLNNDVFGLNPTIEASTSNVNETFFLKPVSKQEILYYSQ